MLNTVYAVGSTGKIVKQIADKALDKGYECMVAHRFEIGNVDYPPYACAVSSWLDCHIHNRINRLTMLRGCFSKFKTFRFLKKVRKFNPDLIHLHNIHGNFINLSMLFRFIKKQNIKVVWTLHDCWPLTGNCKYFDMVNCSKWQYGCGNCPQKKQALIDISSYMLKRKKKMLSGISDMTIVTPSQWLADLVKISYLQDYPVKVINNGIDLSVFKPTESNFKVNYNLTDKKIVLGVAFEWEKRKGLDVFIELSKRLSDDYRIVLVGTDEKVDEMLPEKFVSIHKTNNQQELAAVYSAADVFVNPTREENYPTVNMESLACGTPVVTFDTGGSGEIIDDSCGFVVKKNDIDTLTSKIIEVCEKGVFSVDACLKKAESHNKNHRFDEYISLYEDLE